MALNLKLKKNSMDRNDEWINLIPMSNKKMRGSTWHVGSPGRSGYTNILICGNPTCGSEQFRNQIKIYKSLNYAVKMMKETEPMWPECMKNSTKEFSSQSHFRSPQFQSEHYHILVLKTTIDQFLREKQR